MPACIAHHKPSMAIIHLRALWVSAQRCTPVSTDKWAYISLSLLNDALQRKDALHDVNRIAPLRTTTSTNHRAPW